MCQNTKSEKKKCAITENVRLKIQGKVVEGPQQYRVGKLKDWICNKDIKNEIVHVTELKKELMSKSCMGRKTSYD